MKKNRDYLNTPGQSVTLTVDGPMGSGKTRILDHLSEHFQGQGLFATWDRVAGRDLMVVTCPTARESRDLYLDALDEHQRETLRAHLDALGYEL